MSSNFFIIIIFGAVLANCSPIEALRCKFTNFEGPQKNRTCVFPFIYQDIKFNSCTNRSDSDGKFWCSTKVDVHGKHFGNKNEWGYCEPGCEPRFCDTTNGEGDIKFRKCIFPFTFDAKTYTDCINDKDPEQKFWCSTKVDEKGHHLTGSWGYCHSDCDSDSTTTTTTTSNPDATTLAKISEATQVTTTPTSNSGNLILDKGPRCRLTNNEGPKSFTPCIFPFIIQESVQLNECTSIGDPDGKFWCSTKVSEDGKHITGIGEWGYCDLNCSVLDEEAVATNIIASTATFITTATDASIVFTTTTSQNIAGNNTILEDSITFGQNGTNDLLISDPNLPLEIDQTCGQQSSKRSALLGGGSETMPGAFPFAAAIARKYPDGLIRISCAGALISKRFVITAAFCTDVEVVEVILGKHNLGENPDCSGCSPVQRFSINRNDVIPHEDFNLETTMTSGNDIALIRLPNLAITSHEDSKQYVLPICLAWKSSIHEPTKQNLLVGWDEDSRGSISVMTGSLQHRIVSNVHIDICANLYRKGTTETTVNSVRHICGTGEKTNCLFTSGGPLAVRDGLTGTLYLKGIFSFGPKSCNGTKPQVFTSVKEYIPWIIKNINSS